jgi:ubiquitin C-terminal hydrolase
LNDVKINYNEMHQATEHKTKKAKHEPNLLTKTVNIGSNEWNNINSNINFKNTDEQSRFNLNFWKDITQSITQTNVEGIPNFGNTCYANALIQMLRCLSDDTLGQHVPWSYHKPTRENIQTFIGLCNYQIGTQWVFDY